jgi:hypothetical protein
MALQAHSGKTVGMQQSEFLSAHASSMSRHNSQMDTDSFGYTHGIKAIIDIK